MFGHQQERKVVERGVERVAFTLSAFLSFGHCRDVNYMCVGGETGGGGGSIEFTNTDLLIIIGHIIIDN